MQKHIRSTYTGGAVVLSNWRNNLTDLDETYTKTSIWWDGSAMNMDKVDEFLYVVNSEGEFFRKNFEGPLNVKWFGAKGDGVTDDTAAFQLAIDIAETTELKNIIIPFGNFIISQIQLPNGTVLKGMGLGSFGYSGKVTMITQKAGTNSDLIIFRPTVFGDGRPFVFVEIADMILFGDVTATAGSGICFRSPTVNATIQDNCRLRNLLIRAFKEDGIRFPDGALPLHLIDVNLLWNGGYGINYMVTTNNLTQAVHFDNVSGDGNLLGLIRVKGVDDRGSVLFTNIKSEKRVNVHYADAVGQENVIILEDCVNTAVAIHGVTHISSVPDGGNFQKPGHVIVIKGSVPRLFYSAIAVRIRPLDTGTDPFIIRDEVHERNIDKDFSAGYFGIKELFNITDPSNLAQQRRIIGGKEWLAKSVETPGQQIQGLTPSIGYYQTGADADQKAWLESASGGNFISRTLNDDGTLGMIYRTVVRAGSQITSIVYASVVKFNKGVELGVMAVADVVNNSVFLDSIGAILRYKNSSGVVQKIALDTDLATNTAQTIATAGTLDDLVINPETKLLIITAATDITGIVLETNRLLRIEIRNGSLIIRHENVDSLADNRFQITADITQPENSIYTYIKTNGRIRRVI